MSKRTTNRRANVRLPRRRQFTIADCIKLNAKLNDQTVRTHIRNEIGTTLAICGYRRPEGRGRPAFILTRW